MPPSHDPDRTPAFLLWALEIGVEGQTNGCGGRHRHFIARVALLLLCHPHRMLVYYDVHKDEWYRRRARIFKLFRSWVWDRLPGSKGGSAGPAMRPDPRRLSLVSFVKIWFISKRKKSTDPEASTVAAPTNNTGGLVRKTISISSFHSALSELGVGLGPSATTESFALQQLNPGTAAKPVSTMGPHQRAPLRIGRLSRSFSQTPRPCCVVRKEAWVRRDSPCIRVCSFGCGASRPKRNTSLPSCDLSRDHLTQCYWEAAIHRPPLRLRLILFQLYEEAESPISRTELSLQRRHLFTLDS